MTSRYLAPPEGFEPTERKFLSRRPFKLAIRRNIQDSHCKSHKLKVSAQLRFPTWILLQTCLWEFTSLWDMLLRLLDVASIFDCLYFLSFDEADGKQPILPLVALKFSSGIIRNIADNWKSFFLGEFFLNILNKFGAIFNVDRPLKVRVGRNA